MSLHWIIEDTNNGLRNCVHLADIWQEEHDASDARCLCGLQLVPGTFVDAQNDIVLHDQTFLVVCRECAEWTVQRIWDEGPS